MLRAVLCAFATLALAAGSANAFKMQVYTGPGFEGNVVELQELFPDEGSIVLTRESIVESGIEEFQHVSAFDDVSVDIYLSNFAIYFDFTDSPPGTIFAPADFNGFKIVDKNGTIPEIVGVHIDPWVSKNSPADDIEVTFTGNSITVDFESITVNPATRFKVDVKFVPEPDTLVLVGLGMLGLAMQRRYAAAS